DGGPANARKADCGDVAEIAAADSLVGSRGHASVAMFNRRHIILQAVRTGCAKTRHGQIRRRATPSHTAASEAPPSVPRTNRPTSPVAAWRPDSRADAALPTAILEGL